MFSCNVGAVEQHGVDAVLAFDHIAAVARIPLELIVARAQQRHVVALVAVHEVVTVAAQQLVGTVAAPNRIVARAAVDGELHDPCRHVRSVDPCHPRPAR